MNMTENSTWNSSVDGLVDKSKWSPGLWHSEPDEVRFITSTGLLAMIRRNAAMGTLCGYVGVPQHHSLYGKAYDNEVVLKSISNVHGGITYDGHLIVGVDQWWFGFDCSHSFDIAPAQTSLADNYSYSYSDKGDVVSYKSITFAVSQLERLAQQLVDSQRDIDADLLRSPEH